MRDARFPAASATLFYAAAVLLPVAAMALFSLEETGRLSLQRYAALFTSSANAHLFANSLALSTLVTAVTLIAGVPLGLLLARTDLPFRRTLAALFLVPLLVPPYVLALGWLGFLSPEGLLAAWGFGEAASRLFDSLFGLAGPAAVLAFVYLPIPALVTAVLLHAVPPSLEEAARLVTGWRGVLRHVTLPLILPGIAVSGALVFLLTMGETTVPGLFRFPVFAAQVTTQFAAFYDARSATAYAMPLVGAALLFLWAEERWIRPRMARLSTPFAGAEAATVPLKRWRVPLALLAGVAALLAVAAPMAGLLHEAGAGWLEALRQGGDAMARSLLYAAVGATLLAAAGFVAGYAMQRRVEPWGRILDASTLFLFALPGSVVAVALILFYNRPLLELLYATPALLLLGYLAKYLLLPTRIVALRLAMVPLSLEEAALLSGAGWGRRVLYVVLPLVARGVAAAWLVGFVFLLRDTSVSMLLYPPGEETLSVRILTLMANGDTAVTAALSLGAALLTALPLPALFALMPKGESA